MTTPGVTEPPATWLGGCLRLRELSISGSSLSKVGFEQLTNLSDLRQLTLDTVNIEHNSSLRHLRKLSRLTGLTIRNVNLSHWLVREIAGIDRLQRLWLETMPIGDRELAILTNLRQLSELHLRNTQVSPAAMKSFVESQDLVHGTLNGQPILAP